MGDIKEEDWQYSHIRYGRQGMARNQATSAAASQSSADVVTGGIGVKLAPEVDRGNSFTKTMLSVGSAFNGYTKGAFSVDSEGNIVAPENPYLEHYITFKNVNGKNVSGHKFKSFASLEDQLKTMEGTDSTGPYSTNAMQGAALGVGSSGTLSSLAAGGAMAAIMGMTKGPKDPLTGDSVGQMIPMLSNAILKHKYDAIRKIRTAISKNAPDVGDAFTLGGFSFVREPGKYTFNGNLSAIGLSHEELHGLSAIARGFDPNSYDYKTGTGNRILTYGGTAGYMLDGRHVDYMGRIAGAGIGTMASDTWAAMVNKHFNGNEVIAQEWLAGTTKFRGFSGLKDADAAQAWFNQMASNAHGNYSYNMYDGIGQTPLTNVNATNAMQATASGVAPWQQNMSNRGLNLDGTKFIDPKVEKYLDQLTEEYDKMYYDPSRDTFSQVFDETRELMNMNTPEQPGMGFELPGGEGYRELIDGYYPNKPNPRGGGPYANQFSTSTITSYSGGLEEEMGTESPNVYGNFGSGLTDYMDSFGAVQNLRPTNYSTGYSDFMQGDVDPLTRKQKDESYIKQLFPNNDDINITYYGTLATEHPMMLDGILHNYQGPLSKSWKSSSSEKQVVNNLFKIKSNEPEPAVVFNNQQDKDNDNTSADFGVSASSQITSNMNQSSLNNQIAAATQQAQNLSAIQSYKPSFRKTDSPQGYSGGFKIGGRIGYQEGDMVQSPSQPPQVVGGQMPSQVPQQQTVADNVQDSLKEGTFVINAPAVELAGESDVKNMVMNAFYSAREKGLPIGRADNKLYEKNVDVLLSKGEVTIPPELVKIIGLSKLRKLNNRGLREVERRDAEAKQSQQANFPAQMGGMPQFRTGDKINDTISKVDEAFGRKPAPSSEEILSTQLNNEEMTSVFGSNFTLKKPDPMAIRDGETEIEYKKRVGIIREDSPKSDSESDMVESAGFLNPPVASQPEIDLGLQGAMSEQYVKFADALTKAEWGGEHDTEETRSEDYFLRTMEAPKEGSSAFGPLQITGGLLASNFGDIKHLKKMKDSEQSIVKGPSKLMIENYNKGARGALRDRLSDEEKKFVDALIDQANQFLIFGREEDREGYDPKFDYGGKGNIQEVFPENYKQLYNSIGMKLIQSLSETVDGDPIKFAKLWKAGDNPNKKFTDNRYLEQFTGNLVGFENYLNKKFEGQVVPPPKPKQ